MRIPKEDKLYNYGDYLTWPENEKWEIIRGVPYLQAAPSWQHKAISRELIIKFAEYLRDKTCEIFASPFDLRLPNKEEEDENSIDVIQPDLLIICDKSKLKGTGYFGVPKLVIEIISPSTARIDRILKFNLYENAKVEEYWIIEPETKIVSVFTLQENNRYGRPNLFTEDDSIKVHVFPDLTIDLSGIFNFE